MLDDADQDAFKRWLLPKLETIYEDDVGDLADYVVALVTTNATKDSIQRECKESLKDFLLDHTESFLEELLTTLEQKTFLPQVRAQGKATSTTNKQINLELKAQVPGQIPLIAGNETTEYAAYAPRALGIPPPNAPRGPAALRKPQTSYIQPDRPSVLNFPSGVSGKKSKHNKRKRKAVEREKDETSTGQDLHYNPVDGGSGRKKQTLRKSGNIPTNEVQEDFGNIARFISAVCNIPNLPPPPPGALPFDFTSALAFLTMASASGYKFSEFHSSDLSEHDRPFPALSVSGYDIDQASFALPYDGTGTEQSKQFSQSNGARGSKHKRQASFSVPGTSIDSNNTTLVIEKIPKEKLNDEAVRKFFSQYGDIEEVHTQAYKQLAIVRFADRESASRAYGSPKVIFDNRFVKVYWHMSNSDMDSAKEHGAIPYNGTAESQDPEEVRKRLAEAQLAFDERRRRQDEADVKSKEIDRMIAEMDIDIEVLKRQLAELSTGDDIAAELSNALADIKRAADSSEQHLEKRSVYGGREDYRGYSKRGGLSYAPHPPRHGGGSKYLKLDHRPKRLVVSNIQPGSKIDETLRKHLLNVPGWVNLELHPKKENALVLTFQERYQAEMFLDNSLKIFGIGRLELAWVPNDPPTSGGDISVQDSRHNTPKSGTAEPTSQADADNKPGAVRQDAVLHSDVADGPYEWL